MYYKNLGVRKTEKCPEEGIAELLVFSKEAIKNNKIDFRWIHSREFKYNGEMYDIVKKEEDSSHLFLYCIHDEKEKLLEEEFARKVNDNSRNNKRYHGSNHFNISLSEAVQEEKSDLTPFCEFSFKNFLPEKYISIHLDVPSPPPRSV
jgi:hypothetical protein